MKTLGIIGGMGPMATADLFSKIVQMTKADTDAEHIHVIIDNNPAIPNRMDAILRNGKSAAPAICASAQRLERAGADFLIIGCNTAHYYYPQVCDSVDIPVINMIEVAAKQAADEGIRRIGLLATDAVLQIGLYDSPFKSLGIEVIQPDANCQAEVMRIIFEGVKGGKRHYDTFALNQGLKAMLDAGVQRFILACTELPIAFSIYDIAFPYIDPTTALAVEAIRYAGAKVNL